MEKVKMKDFMKASAVATVVTALTVTATSVVAEGGFVGLGITAAPDYEGGDDYVAAPALFGRYNFNEGRYVALVGSADAARGGRFVLNLVPNSSWEMGPALGVRYERNDPDNDRVKRMDDIDFATEAGGFVSYKSGGWFGTLGLMFDVSDTYGGYIGDLRGGYRQKVSDDFSFTYSASVSYVDDEYMEEYFGVDGSDAASSGLPFYKADGGIKDYGLGIGADYKFNKTWGLIATINYYRLTGDAEDSPIVEDEGDKNQYKTALALSYSF
jgi:outer membrane protein